MQKLIEFRAKNFWSSKIDTAQLNKRIAEYNQEGWTVTQVSPLTTFSGFVSGYALLLEKT